MIKGEYWITDTGEIEYADGDIGDYNHEMLVIQTVRYILLNAINADTDFNTEFLDKDTFITAIINETETDEAKKENIEEILTKKLEELNQTNIISHIPIALEKGDARYFAMQQLGWCWIKNNSATVWQINKESLNLIKNGISEILTDENDENIEEFNITISSAKTNRSYNINWIELETGNIEFSNNNYIFESKGNDQISKMDKALEPKCYKNIY